MGFKDLHPELFRRKRDKKDEHELDAKSDDEKKQKKAFDPKMTFKKSTTEKIREGYIRLFEAAWSGDIDEVKQLTLANWGPEKDNTPLMVTVQDSKGFTPFVIAMYRRHLGLARTILEIANAQFKGSDEDTPRRRYTLAEAESDDSCDSDEDELGLSSQIVDETFTIDNIAALGQSVGSKVSGKLIVRSGSNRIRLIIPSFRHAPKAHRNLVSARPLRNGRARNPWVRDASADFCDGHYANRSSSAADPTCLRYPTISIALVFCRIACPKGVTRASILAVTFSPATTWTYFAYGFTAAERHRR